MKKDKPARPINPTKSPEAEALDSLNAQKRAKPDTTREIEASIETKAKKRRSQQTPASSSWKQS